MTRREQWDWIQAHEPELSALLLDLKAAGMPVRGILWRQGGPEAKEAE